MPGDHRRSTAGARLRRAAARSFACALLLATHMPAAGQDATFDYLHVEANEGSASGGHVAIRFDDDTYHFQHHPGGMLRLHRDDSAAFLHAYGRLENRPVHVRRVAVDAATRDRLRQRFADRFILEEAQHARLDALRADLALLDELLAGRTPPVTVRGARFFAPAGADVPNESPGDHALAAVRATIEQRHPGLLATRRDATRRALRDLVARHAARDDEADANAPPMLDPHRLRLPGGTLVEELAELLEASAALEVLASAAALRREAVRDDGDSLLLLGDAERAALTGLGSQLAERAISLAASRRPDWGRTLLLTLARLATVEESLARGRLVVLDAYPRDADVLAPADVSAAAHALPELLRESATELAAARRPLATTGPPATTAAPRETDFTAVEAAVNRHLELSHATSNGASLRVVRGTLLPSGEAPVPLPAVLADAEPAALRAARDAVARRSDAWTAALRARYGYDLLARNCVSELFHEIAAALAPGDGGGGASGGTELDCTGSVAALGGCVDPASRLRFIPFVSADAVDAEYRVVEREDVPSFRAAALADQTSRDGRLAVLLRESNVLSSSLYQPRSEDSVFLFFTDDWPAARPLLGAANLVTGLGATAAGLLTLPVDDGTLLVRGLRGALFSAPELVFVSIRKGTFAWTPRADAAPP